MSDKKNDNQDVQAMDADDIMQELINEYKLQLEIAQVAVNKEKARTEDMKALASRLQADFDNFRKRSAETQKKSEEDGVAKVIKKMLSVLDNLRQAILMTADPKTIEGLKMITRQMAEAFDSFGVTEIPALGEDFDPSVHNAVQTEAAKNNAQVGKIIEVYEKGFRLGDRIIRHSMVKVAK